MSAPTPPPVAPQGSARGKNPMVNLSITDKFITVARGTGGVDELAMFLDESLVMWGLVKVVVGSGAMARSKFVFLYFSGAGMSTVKRMRFTERRPGAVAALGGGMIDWDREHVKDVTLDTLLEKVLSAVVADDGGADMSVSAMREQALAQIKAAEEALKRKPALKRGVSQGGRSGRVSQGGGKTALALRAELGFKDVLDMVRNPKGGLNWSKRRLRFRSSAFDGSSAFDIVRAPSSPFECLRYRSSAFDSIRAPSCTPERCLMGRCRAPSSAVACR